jgi:hypothetical protein
LQRKPSAKILDDRPGPDHIPPVSLLYDGFGLFHDTSSRWGDEHDMDTKRSNLANAVDAFAEKMTDIYPAELERREAGLNALNSIFFLDGHHQLMVAFIDTVHTDGHCNGPHGAASCIVKFRDEPADIKSIPEVELTGYAAHSHKQSIKTSEKGKKVLLGWRVPCLGLTIVGKLTLQFQVNWMRCASY